jgi:Na+/proline symporter
MGFSEWPARRILLLSGGWIVAYLTLLAWQLFRAISATGSGGIGATSVGLLELVAIPFGPPLVFGLLWLVLRRRASG